MDDIRCIYSGFLDRDGHIDLLTASFDGDKIAWYPNDGQGGFAPVEAISPQEGSAYAVYASDIDGDGDLDVLSASAITWYENQGLGSFGPEQIISTHTYWANSIYSADLDGDGDRDIVSASDRDNKVAWYENLRPPAATESLFIYPNPFNSQAMVVLGMAHDPITVQVVDLTGRVVQEQKLGAVEHFTLKRGSITAGGSRINTEKDSKRARIVVQ
ncbi:MAG: T9SS type A sorting domain-containing protein [Flavobacteriales bacterium]|nr:T9SS type A sorting domain-containing protein [Flavobacteriales bacterium]